MQLTKKRMGSNSVKEHAHNSEKFAAGKNGKILEKTESAPSIQDHLAGNDREVDV